MTTWLLDGNVLVARSLFDHPHHQRVRGWLIANRRDALATCAITEGTLLRLHMFHAMDKSAAAAWSALESVHAHPRHIFWPESFSYVEVRHARLLGHRQVTDAWLVELARRKGGKLATLDETLAVLWPELATLVPVVV